jgi:hypothetical protein
MHWVKPLMIQSLLSDGINQLGTKLSTHDGDFWGYTITITVLGARNSGVSKINTFITFLRSKRWN